MSEKQNGWTNFETWSAYTWLTAEEQPTKDIEAAAAAALDEADGDAEAAAEILAPQIKQYIPAKAPDIAAGLFRDILDEALHEINYNEIAAAFLE